MREAVQTKGREINLMDQYPCSKRPVEQRGVQVTETDRGRARKFGQEYFDGDRLFGYGGYAYHPRFWQATVRRFRDFYRLTEQSSILDVGCAKGFMLNDLKELLPDARVAGLDISTYAIQNAKESVRDFLTVGDASHLPYPDHSFDLVISINTVHNLPNNLCKKALSEIQRVSKKNAFVTVDAWRNEEERTRLLQWNLTALTFMHVDDWKNLFDEVGYTGDYYWFLA